MISTLDRLSRRSFMLIRSLCELFAAFLARSYLGLDTVQGCDSRCLAAHNSVGLRKSCTSTGLAIFDSETQLLAGLLP